MKFIAKNIRILRRRANLSQTAFAGEIGLNRGNIASYEKGVAEPNALKLLRISRFFNVRLIDLIEKNMEEGVGNEGPNVIKNKLKEGLARNPMSRGVEGLEEWDDFAHKTVRLQRIYDGLRELHLFSFQTEGKTTSPEKILYDYERLLEVTGELLALNQKFLTHFWQGNQ